MLEECKKINLNINIMPQYADCYFLIPSRKKETLKKILSYFLPKRESSTDENIVEDSITFSSVDSLMVYLEQKDDLEYSLYWSNLDLQSDIRHAMVFYTSDKKMIFGVSIPAKEPDDERVVSLFFEIQSLLNSDLSCITVEEAPPTTTSEFEVFCKNRFIPSP